MANGKSSSFYGLYGATGSTLKKVRVFHGRTCADLVNMGGLLKVFRVSNSLKSISVFLVVVIQRKAAMKIPPQKRMTKQRKSRL